MNKELIGQVERHGIALEKAFEGADSCRNVDRIARLPGCVNWPTADKRDKKGQGPALARVVQSDFGVAYPLEALPISDQGTSVVVAHKEDVQVNTEGVKAIDNLDELDRFNVPQRIKDIVLRGKGDQPKAGDNSSSAWLFDGVCGLVRAGVPNDTIFSIITDRRFGVSEHILKQGRRYKEYAVRQIQRACNAVSVKREEVWDVTDAVGNPKASYNNARVAIKKLGIVCERDAFHNRDKIGGHVLQHYQGELSDHACAIMRQSILENFGFDPKKEHVRDAAMQLCLENVFNPVRDYLDSLSWDGIPRLDKLLVDYFGVDNTPINRAIGRMLLVAAVRRVREPGCKFDTIVVLEGRQGTGKSTALVVLAGKENFSDQDILALDAKAQMEAIEGVWLYEISELEGMSRSEITKVKAFASRQEDRARPAYGRFRENRSRQCVFIGTTNEEGYLRDKTGNRRFLPVRTNAIDLEALLRDRDQLWAEACEAEAQGESITLDPGLWEEAAQLQQDRMEHEPWIDLLANVQGERQGQFYKVTTAELLRDHLKIPEERHSPIIFKRLGYAMRKLGWEGPKPLRYSATNVQRGFIRRAEPEQMELPDYMASSPGGAGNDDETPINE